jgi:thioredoxin reductase (NADPH)
MAGLKVDFSGDIHKVWINDTIELHCETVIIYRSNCKVLRFASEQHYLKWVVVFLLVQFAMVFYRNQEVVIVGAGFSL